MYLKAVECFFYFFVKLNWLTVVLVEICSEDAEKLRMHTVAEAGDMDSLEKMVDASDSEDSGSESGSAP